VSRKLFVSTESIYIIESVLPHRLWNYFFNCLTELNLSSSEVGPTVKYKSQLGLIVIFMV